ncbi:MAG: hypothetical protein N3C12_01840 [Candidatus Binatia bacterium]|nr:hypothetical protein [Candidatus Binatia bacterium]
MPGFGRAASALFLGCAFFAAGARALCPGDCNRNGEVTVDEVILSVRLVLQEESLGACAAADANGNGEVTVDEIVRAVRAVLEGCPGSVVYYDREDLRRTNPFPDDYWLADDANQPTGVRLNIAPPVATSDVNGIFRILLREVNRLDGFSPIAHFVIELSDAPDLQSLPLTPAESLESGQSIGLFDLTPGSPTFGQRVPFRIMVRDEASVLGVRSHSLLLFPSISLTPGGRYGLVVAAPLRNVAGEPFRPTPFFRRVLGAEQAGDSAAVRKVRALSREVLSVVAEREPALASSALLAVRLSVRSMRSIADDLLAIKEQVDNAPPPRFEVSLVTPESSPTSAVAAIVRGTWEAPDWRDGLYLARDANGRPRQTKTNRVGFVLALPKASLERPAPITMYQHGNPGSAEREVPIEARDYLASAGFAVAGFTDNLNREVSAGATNQEEAIVRQVTAVFFALVQDRRIPDYWTELNAEQLAFVRLLKSLGSLDVLPVGAPDGVPDLDPSLPLTYVGISQGANYAPGLLPYAPEIGAAALVVGGARLTETLIHQRPDDFVRLLGQVFPNMTPADIWTAMSLFQHGFDRQDEHNHGRFLYREPLEVAGTRKKASVLLTEGLEDSLVPNHTTEALAWLMGPIPHLAPVQRPVPFLSVVSGPLQGNIDAQTTAAFFQFVPTGIPNLPPTPGCAALSPAIGSEGHYCAQDAAEARRQRIEFLRSALEGAAPRIIDPFAP